MAVTIEEVREYLDSQKLEVTDGMLTRIMSKVAALQPCFDSHGYSDDDVYFITIYLCALLVLVGSGDGRIRSETSPSGASRSFAINATSERWKGLRDMLRIYDPNNCAGPLIPPDPAKKYHCALFVSPGAGNE